MGGGVHGGSSSYDNLWQTAVLGHTHLGQGLCRGRGTVQMVSGSAEGVYAKGEGRAHPQPRSAELSTAAAAQPPQSKQLWLQQQELQ